MDGTAECELADIGVKDLVELVLERLQEDEMVGVLELAR